VDLPPGIVWLISNNGEYLTCCSNCGPGIFPNSAATQSYMVRSLTVGAILRQDWTLEVYGTQVAFKGSNGRYLARCNRCWSKGADYLDSVFVHAATPTTVAFWTPVAQGNGKYSFRADNGMFLSRCTRCVKEGIYINFAFVFSTSPASALAQWDVQYANLPRTGRATLKADNGQFLKLCPRCGGNKPGSAVSIEGTSEFWDIKRIGNKIALQAVNGKYLSVCAGCWTGAKFPESASAFMNNPTDPTAQWKPLRMQNGNWTFQGSNGKYLARCNACATSSSPNLAFVYSTSVFEAAAQWSLA
jgi:hypothetical protein